MRFFIRLTGLVAFGLLLSACHQNGTVFAVDTTLDTVDSNPGDGVCSDASGDCSVRAAVMEANALPGVEEIRLVDHAEYVLDIGSLATPSAATNDIDITDGVVLTGMGRFSRSDNSDVPIFRVETVGLVEFIGTRFDRVSVAIAVEGPGMTTVRDALFSSIGTNGVEVNGGALLMASSALVFQSGGGDDAGINVIDGVVHIENTSIHSGSNVVGIRNVDGTVTVLHSSFDAGIEVKSWGTGSVSVQSSIVTRFCTGSIVSLGHNFGVGECVTEPSDIARVGYPGIGPMIDLGGPAPVLRVDFTSDAIDSAGLAGCAKSSKDARGLSRPIGSECDIGAVEIDPGDCATGVVGGNVRFCDLTDADVSGLDLSGLDAVGVTAVRLDATGTDFSGAKLNGVGLKDAVFANADLSGAQISQPFNGYHPSAGSMNAPGADFSNAEIDHIHIYDATGANFTNARLNGSVLSDVFDSTPAYMTDAIVEGADFSQAYFWGVTSGGVVGTPASMRRGSGIIDGYIIDTFVELHDVDFAGVDFGTIAPGRVRFLDSDLSGVTIREGAWAVRFDGSTIDHASISGIYLANASFERASAVGTDFSESDMESTNWSYATVVGADFTDASLSTSNFRDALLLWSTFDNTICPSGVNSDDNGGNCDGQFNGNDPLAGAEVPPEFQGMSPADFGVEE